MNKKSKFGGLCRVGIQEKALWQNLEIIFFLEIFLQVKGKVAFRRKNSRYFVSYREMKNSQNFIIFCEIKRKNRQNFVKQGKNVHRGIPLEPEVHQGSPRPLCVLHHQNSMFPGSRH